MLSNLFTPSEISNLSSKCQKISCFCVLVISYEGQMIHSELVTHKTANAMTIEGIYSIN